jgi:hypothetical protein
MPTFDTPGPVHARVDVAGGSLRVRATDRSDTVVEVRAVIALAGYLWARAKYDSRPAR